MMSKSIQLEEIQLGVCYYPEHWPESMWEDDLRRMRELNITVIRVAEFAWSIFEPEEGIFRFDFFRQVLDLAQQQGLKVILGTPTATPPAWLTERYPEVLNATKEGTLYRHGMRRHYNYSSPKYRELCARIVIRMAEAYADHPAVIGWQLDNEFNCEKNVFYAEADHVAFREWVKQRYGTLDKLNEAWGTVFWSQTYTDWNQVYLSRPTVSGAVNPHLALDEKRFISDNTTSFARLQADILRERIPAHQWITTNGSFGHLDNHRLTDELLDFFSYDSYPQFATLESSNEVKPLKDRRWGLSLSNIRSISPNFCVMEQQSGPGGWVNRMEMPSPRPGQMRLWSYQSILHGTDLLVYFRWRTATFGTEMYWHGINDYHNRPNRRVREVGQIGQEIGKIGKALAGSRYQAKVALMQDYDNAWDGEYDKWHGPLHWRSMIAWYKQLQYHHIPTDVITMRVGTNVEELLQYEVIVYPHAAILTEDTAAILTEYAERGGKIVFGARTGYKNAYGQCNMSPLPGAVAELCGVTVEDFTLINGDLGATLRWSDGGAEPGAVAEMFNDILEVEDSSVEVIAAYASQYYSGKPALTRRSVGQGQGSAWYYGAAFSEPVVDELIRRLGLTSPTASWLELPEEVELGIRSSESTDYVFLLNYGYTPSAFTLKTPVLEMLSGETMSGKVELPPYDVMIFCKE